MQEIIIDGVNLNEMKAKHDALQAEMAEALSKIRQGAAKFIAENIQQGKKLMDEMLEEEDAAKVNEVAKQAYDLLSAASFVSDVAGVSFDLPYYDRQGEYYPCGESYSRQIDDSDNSAVVDSDEVTKLYGLLENMEWEVSDWNTSYC